MCSELDLESKRRCFTTSDLSRELPQISLAVLYKTTTVRLDYHKFCERCVPKILMDEYKTHRMASVFTFFFLER